MTKSIIILVVGFIVAFVSGSLIVDRQFKSGAFYLTLFCMLVGVCGIGTGAVGVSNRWIDADNISHCERSYYTGVRYQKQYRHDHAQYVRVHRQLRRMSANNFHDPKITRLRVGQAHDYFRKQDELRKYASSLKARCVYDRQQTRLADPRHARQDRRVIIRHARHAHLRIHKNRLPPA